MATTWKAPTWRMPNDKNQSKFESYSIEFNGSSSIITCGNLSQLNNSTGASFSMWLNVNSTGTEGLFNQWGTGTDRLIYSFINLSLGRIDVYVSPNISFRVTENSIINSLSIGEWFNLVITYDSTEPTSTNRVKAYINNQELTGNVFGGPTSLYNSTTDFILGAYPSGTYFDGKMSQVCIFDYTLSSTQVSSLYNSGSPINPMTLKPAPIASYLLGGNASTGGDDLSTIENPNTLSVPNVAVPDASVFDFDGISQYIDCGDSDSFTFGDGTTDSPFSVSAWFNADTLTAGERFTIGKYDSGAEWLLQARENFIIFALYDSSNQAYYLSTRYSATIDTGVWTNVIFTYDGSSDATGCKMYINGSLVTTTTTENNYTAMGNKSSDLKIGARSGKEFDGKMSNVQIWSGTLTDGGVSVGATAGGEVATIYNNGQPLMTGTQPQAANLKAWYKLDQLNSYWDIAETGNWTISNEAIN